MKRMHFWLTYLGVIIVSAVAGGILGATSTADYETMLAQAQLLGMVIGVPTMAVAMWFRLKDAGKSRHWLWLYLVPLLSLIPFCMAGFLPSANSKEAAA